MIGKFSVCRTGCGKDHGLRRFGAGIDVYSFWATASVPCLLSIARAHKTSLKRARMALLWALSIAASQYGPRYQDVVSLVASTLIASFKVLTLSLKICIICSGKVKNRMGAVWSGSVNENSQSVEMKIDIKSC